VQVTNKLKIAAATLIFLYILSGILLSGCTREQPSSKPPIHPIRDMYDQPKYKPQGEGKFFENDAAMRTPVAGTVERGYLRNDDIYYKGMNPDGGFVKEAPVDVTLQLLNRGHERFDIYCSPCHSRVGDGKGIMVSRGYVPPPSFHTDRIRNMPDGEIFDVITHGVRNMPSYAHQINPDDRWAIIKYLRALERSHNATIEDVPVELRDKIK
jgi:mono/diheme cytochrome c family protein